MKVLTLVLAGGEGTRLHPLTAEHSKPALPFANGYRIVDFVLSNLLNSGLLSIYLMAQYKPQSLIRHVDTVWRPELQRRKGFVRPLLPQPDVGRGYFEGTADAVYQNLELIERHEPDLVAVFAADHIYRMDIAQMVCFHRARNAEVTVAAVPVPVDNASSFGVIVADRDGAMREFQEKPQRPTPMLENPDWAYVSMGNYLFEPNVLQWLLRAAQLRDATDFGRDILPQLPGAARVYAYNFARNYVPGVKAHEERSYWRDVGTLDALAAARADSAGPHPRFDLRNPQWPIHGAPHPAPVRTLDWPMHAGRASLPAMPLTAAAREEPRAAPY